MKTLTLCADDFAQNPAISEGILALIDAGRLSATSVMTESPHWRTLAPALMARHDKADLGLHFNLTHDFGQGAAGLGGLLVQSQLRRLDGRVIERTLLAQLDAFAEAAGVLPDFIDGHQHVHALPVVRDALFRAVRARYTGSQRPYLRCPDRLGDGGDSPHKARILAFCCRGFARMAGQQGYPGTWFGGMYSLDPDADFPALMRRWLQRMPSSGLMMCHPGLFAHDPSDPIAATRVNEYRYLASAEFVADLAEHGVRLSRGQPDPARTAAT